MLKSKGIEPSKEDYKYYSLHDIKEFYGIKNIRYFYDLNDGNDFDFYTMANILKNDDSIFLKE